MRAGLGVGLLGEKAHVIRESAEFIEERFRLPAPARRQQRVDQPEGANQESALRPLPPSSPS